MALMKSFLLATLLLFSVSGWAQKEVAAPPSKAAFDDAKKMLGTVPTMLKLIPEASVAGAWAEFKGLQLSPNTALPPKYKELIGAAVAAQIPCQYCSYFHSQAAMELNKGTQLEVREAIALAAITRHWSTVLNGIHQDEASFRKDVDRIFRSPQPRQAGSDESGAATGTVSGATSAPTAKMVPAVARTVDDVYKEARRMWGFVPQFISSFPSEGIVGAWNQYQALEVSSSTEIPRKYKSLISLAVASQVPCSYCVIFDTRAAKENGASSREINEAIAIAALTRHWSTILNGNLVSENDFRLEVDQIVKFVKTASASTGTTSSTTSESQ